MSHKCSPKVCQGLKGISVLVRLTIHAQSKMLRSDDLTKLRQHLWNYAHFPFLASSTPNSKLQSQPFSKVGTARLHQGIQFHHFVYLNMGLQVQLA